MNILIACEESPACMKDTLMAFQHKQALTERNNYEQTIDI